MSKINEMRSVKLNSLTFQTYCEKVVNIALKQKIENVTGMSLRTIFMPQHTILATYHINKGFNN